MLDTFVLAETGAARRVAGLASLDRLVLTALAAGAARIVVATADPERAAGLLRPSSTARAAISFVRPGSAEEAAALAALAAEGRPFVFVHTEAALAPKSLALLVRDAGGADGVAIASQAQGELPAAALLPARMAPLLAGGAMRAAAALLPALAQAALVGRLRHFEAEGFLAFPVRSDVEAAAATRALVRAAGKKTDGLVSRALNRRVSGAITRLLLGTPVTPNALTLLTLLLGLATGWILLEGGHGAFVLGAFLYHVNSTIDGCDGEIARLKFQTSRFGEWADTICDQAGNIAFALAVPLGLWRRHGHDAAYLWTGVALALALAATLVAVWLRTRRLSRAGHFNDYGRSLARGMPAGSLRARALGLASLVLRRDSYALLFFVLALAGLDEWILRLLVLGVAVHFLSFLLPAARAAEAGG